MKAGDWRPGLSVKVSFGSSSRGSQRDSGYLGVAKKSVNLAVYRALAHDLSSIIDRCSRLQIPRRALRDEVVEVLRHFTCQMRARELKVVPSIEKPTTWPLLLMVLQQGATVKTAPGKAPRSCIPVSLVHRKA